MFERSSYTRLSSQISRATISLGLSNGSPVLELILLLDTIPTPSLRHVCPSLGTRIAGALSLS